jgi:hypothetical protein
MRGVPSGLVIISLLMLSCLAEGIPLRGAIEVGMGVEMDGQELSGQVMVSCHELESRLAQTIRIVVGPALLSMVEQGRRLSESDSRYYREDRNLSNLVASFTKRDPTDGLYVLDYLAVTKSVAQGQQGFDEQTRKSLAYLWQQEEYWTKAMRLDIAQKYRAGIMYFASCGHGIQTSPGSEPPGRQNGEPHGNQ